MELKVERFTKVIFISVIIITSGLIGPLDTRRTRLLRKNFMRRQENNMEEMNKQMETTTVMETPMVMMMEMQSESPQNSNSSGELMMGMSSNSNVNVQAEESRDTRGIRGFLPGFNLGGGNGGSGSGGKGLFGGLKGVFGGSGAVTNSGMGVGGGETNKFPEYPGGGTDNGNGGGGWSSTESSGGWTQSESSGGKGLFSSLFKNPFGGGKGGGGKSRGPFRLLSRLNQDQPCAVGLSSLPILSRIPFIPQKRFPSFIPSGVNTCDATCDSGPGGGIWRRVPPTKEEKKQMGDANDNSCTYNWRDSLMGLPFLLFRCQCKKKCPPKRVRIGGIFSSQCENVSGMKTRCKCPYGQDTYKCTITILPLSVPLIQRKKPYYCTCCNENTPGQPVEGGYDLKPATSSPSAENVQMPAASVEMLEGGYGYGGANSANADAISEQGTSSNILQREVSIGRPLGAEHFYEHL